MSKIMRMCVLVASLMSLFGVMSSSAGAVTWVNDGGRHFSATSGPGTLSSGGVNLNCAGGDATGDVGASGFVGATWTSAATFKATFTSCFLAGVPTKVHCHFTLTATGQSVAGVTNGDVHTTCEAFQGPVKICHISGVVPGHYVNPPNPRLTVTASAGLRGTDVPPNSCPLGNETPMSLTELTFAIHSSNPPIITRLP